MNLIVPMAGRSTRFPNMRPKWMLTHPSGRFMAIEAIRGLNLDDFDRICFTCLQEHEEKHAFRKGFEEELEELGLLDRTEIILLPEPTVDQPETVLQTIVRAEVEGPIFIKDSDNYFQVSVSPGNGICYHDLNESGLIKPKNKSYITTDSNGFISNVIEKKVISPWFCVGGYGFESAALFVQCLRELPFCTDRYISHVIYHGILQGVKYTGQKVSGYADWGTLEDWERFKRSFATLFIDIDGTLVKNSSAHFPPYIGNTPLLEGNAEIIRELYQTGKFQIILTTSRPEKYRQHTVEQMNREDIPYDGLIMGLFHAKRIIINDYSKSNPYKSCDAINLRRDSNELKEILRESLGVDYEDI